jgi:anti-sigma-K factor RskA
MAEKHVNELIPGYALGCLDEEDRLAVVRHLPHCTACRKELASYQLTMEGLVMAVPSHSPTPGLKGKVLRRVERSAQKHALEERERGRWNFLDALGSLLAHPVGLAFGVFVVVLIVFLGINNLMLQKQVGSLQAHLPASIGNMRVVHLEGTPKAPQAVAYLMVFKNETYGALAVEDAPLLDATHQYQVWLIKDGKRTSGGVFSVNENGYGTLEVTGDQPLENYQSFGITIEPTGGSPGPTGEKVLGGSL